MTEGRVQHNGRWIGKRKPRTKERKRQVKGKGQPYTNCGGENVIFQKETILLTHENLTSAEPSPSAGRVHSESPLSASGFCFRLPGWLWQTAVNCGPLLASLFGL